MLLPPTPGPAAGPLPPRYLLVPVRPSTPGGRFRVRRHVVLRLGAEHPRLRRGYAVMAGRGLTGTRTVFSKGRRARHSTYLPLHQGGVWLHRLSLLVGFVPRGRGFGLANLLQTAVGAWLHTPGSQHSFLLAYVQAVPQAAWAGAALCAQANWLWPLWQLAPHTRVCQVGPGGARPRFALAPGAACLLLAPRVWERWALLALPSGQLRFAHTEAYALLGAPSPAGHGQAFGVRAGFQRNRGLCPRVRGTAMNPNDHPHGGRTRAQRWQRTPWGRTAKQPRRPGGVPKLKVLVKRMVRHSRLRASPVWDVGGSELGLFEGPGPEPEPGLGLAVASEA